MVKEEAVEYDDEEEIIADKNTIELVCLSNKEKKKNEEEYAFLGCSSKEDTSVEWEEILEKDKKYKPMKNKPSCSRCIEPTPVNKSKSEGKKLLDQILEDFMKCSLPSEDTIFSEEEDLIKKITTDLDNTEENTHRSRR